MNRRSPVRSVLEQRKMFSNGGMLPISTPFQNTPSGILASSSPLIETVSQEILAPMTGGARPMAEGGVAKFRKGGANDLRRKIRYALSIEPDQTYETEGGLYTSNEEILTLLQKVDPNDPIYPEIVTAAEKRGLSIPTPQESYQLADAPSSLIQAADAGETGSNLITVQELDAPSPTPLDPKDLISEVLMDKVPGPPPPSPTMRPQRKPGFIVAQEPSAVRYFRPLGSVSAKRPALLSASPSSAISSGLTPPASQFPGETLTVEQAQQDSERMTNWWNNLDPEQRTGAAVFAANRRLEEVDANNENRQNAIDTAYYDTFFANPDQDDTYGVATSRMILEGASEEEISTAGKNVGALDLSREREVSETETIAATTDEAVSKITEERVKELFPNIDDESLAHLMENAKSNPEADLGYLMQPNLMFPEDLIDSFRATSKGTSPGEIIEKTAIDAVAEKAKHFAFNAAAQEFKDAMPEYKEDNSGYNLMLLGAAIMAGESDNWATNVGAGMKEVLPRFIKDRKDKEAFMRSLDLSAGKYALGRRDTLENERRVSERNKSGYYLDNDITFRDDSGNIVETFTEGFNRLNDRQVSAIQAQEGIQLTPLNVHLEGIKESNAKAAAKAKALVDKYANFNPYGKPTVKNITLAPGLVVDQVVSYMDPNAKIKYRTEVASLPNIYLPDGGAAVNSAYGGGKR